MVLIRLSRAPTDTTSCINDVLPKSAPGAGSVYCLGPFGKIQSRPARLVLPGPQHAEAGREDGRADGSTEGCRGGGNKSELDITSAVGFELHVRFGRTRKARHYTKRPKLYSSLLDLLFSPSFAHSFRLNRSCLSFFRCNLVLLSSPSQQARDRWFRRASLNLTWVPLCRSSDQPHIERNACFSQLTRQSKGHVRSTSVVALRFLVDARGDGSRRARPSFASRTRLEFLLFELPLRLQVRMKTMAPVVWLPRRLVRLVRGLAG